MVEADGPLHAAPEQSAYDAHRDDVLRRDGFRVLRFNQDEILGNLGRVIAKIRSVLQAPSPDP